MQTFKLSFSLGWILRWHISYPGIYPCPFSSIWKMFSSIWTTLLFTVLHTIIGTPFPPALTLQYHWKLMLLFSISSSVYKSKAKDWINVKISSVMTYCCRAWLNSSETSVGTTSRKWHWKSLVLMRTHQLFQLTISKLSHGRTVSKSSHLIWHHQATLWKAPIPTLIALTFFSLQ